MSDLNDPLKESYIGKVADALTAYAADLTAKGFNPAALITQLIGAGPAIETANKNRKAAEKAATDAVKNVHNVREQYYTQATGAVSLAEGLLGKNHDLAVKLRSLRADLIGNQNPDGTPSPTPPPTPETGSNPNAEVGVGDGAVSAQRPAAERGSVTRSTSAQPQIKNSPGLFAHPHAAGHRPALRTSFVGICRHGTGKFREPADWKVGATAARRLRRSADFAGKPGGIAKKPGFEAKKLVVWPNDLPELPDDLGRLPSPAGILAKYRRRQADNPGRWAKYPPEMADNLGRFKEYPTFCSRNQCRLAGNPFRFSIGRLRWPVRPGGLADDQSRERLSAGIFAGMTV